jgi:hypothetical protein
MAQIQPSSYYFSFYDNQNFDRIFYGRLSSHRCTYTKANHQQCKRRAVIGFEYCSTHLPMAKHLQIRESTIENAGKGLFAYLENAPNNSIVFRNGDTICQYNGEHISRQELMNRYQGKTAPYAFQLNQNEMIDSALDRGIGSLANTKANHNNARFSINNQNHTVSIKATKNIRNNEEIFIPYGRSYHFPQQENVHYYSKPYPSQY